MSELIPLLLTALALGLLGGGHCIGMCGGLMGALTMAIPAEERQGWPLWRVLLGYNLGRIASYSAAGALLGSLGWLARDAGLGPALRVIAGLLMIAMGLYLANWWAGLTRIEAVGRGLWKYLQPVARRLMPVTHMPQAIALGAVWGWLPCGLVYSTLIWASSQGSAPVSASLMLAFGLGTLPTLLATGLAAQKMLALLRRRPVRITAAVLVILFGIWTIPGPHTAWVMRGGHGAHAHSDDDPVVPSHETGNAHTHH
ncbi:sulfite exporter TauE/SafE family protein [Halopseudomonas nanhaiensis]|uniref:sulfite exporter TauE/SafE family protein n=1 Tax=Halopseudomonas nanhaiensis TaxID=2830842 RepID=UPI001CBC8C1B|nr:sulfite exporter TauE/SafE family protein [Halopseudomonas nanhaiensis]UAW97303.1 sulfite exporter TauE/SafE family protein [Halopseudomonas nanhaiensis]